MKNNMKEENVMTTKKQGRSEWKRRKQRSERK